MKPTMLRSDTQYVTLGFPSSLANSYHPIAVTGVSVRESIVCLFKREHIPTPLLKHKLDCAIAVDFGGGLCSSKDVGPVRPTGLPSLEHVAGAINHTNKITLFKIKIYSHAYPLNALLVDDRKLLFESAESLTQESGRCQPFFLFLVRD